jgi:hypothetical protein
MRVQPLGGIALGEQRPGPRLDPERPVGPGRAGDRDQEPQGTSGALGLSGPGRGLDQLDGGPGRQPQLAGVFAALLGGRQRPIIAAQAVVEYRVRPVRERDADSLPAPRHLPCGGPDQRGGLGFLAAQHGQAQGSVRCEVAARGLRRRLHLLDQRRRRGQLAGEQQQVGT